MLKFQSRLYVISFFLVYRYESSRSLESESSDVLQDVLGAPQDVTAFRSITVMHYSEFHSYRRVLCWT
jgi:hypothetical protein